jgi:hypothetical protein
MRITFLLCMLIQWASAKTIELVNLKSESVNIIQATEYDYAPGDTLLIPAGNWAGLRFIHFEGSAQRPVIITNANGQVLINETTYHGIQLNGCKHIHLTGTGSAKYKYGIWVQSASPTKAGLGVAISD